MRSSLVQSLRLLSRSRYGDIVDVAVAMLADCWLVGVTVEVVVIVEVPHALRPSMSLRSLTTAYSALTIEAPTIKAREA